jgi:Polyphosphate kinase 2 (PPK2)
MPNKPLAPPVVEFARYRVDPQEGFRLEDSDTADTDGLTADEARGELATLTERIADLQARLYAQEECAVLVVLQGIDAAGKDSTVKHVFRGSNPQGVRVYSFKEPTEEEAAHDFLWRYHRDAPLRGMIHVFNRSHYEDVLVVRVKGLVEEERWRSRYDSINDFERMLARTAQLGCLPGRLRGRAEPHRDRVGAVVRRPVGSQVVPEPRGRAHRVRDARGDRSAVAATGCRGRGLRARRALRLMG